MCTSTPTVAPLFFTLMKIEEIEDLLDHQFQGAIVQPGMHLDGDNQVRVDASVL